jgi:rubrerythrin
MLKSKSKIARYLEKEEREEKSKAIITGKIHICISCGDKIEIGNLKGKINCPACGWANEIK